MSPVILLPPGGEGLKDQEGTGLTGLFKSLVPLAEGRFEMFLQFGIREAEGNLLEMQMQFQKIDVPFFHRFADSVVFENVVAGVETAQRLEIVPLVRRRRIGAEEGGARRSRDGDLHVAEGDRSLLPQNADRQ